MHVTLCLFESGGMEIARESCVCCSMKTPYFHYFSLVKVLTLLVDCNTALVECQGKFSDKCRLWKPGKRLQQDACSKHWV